MPLSPKWELQRGKNQCRISSAGVQSESASEDKSNLDENSLNFNTRGGHHLREALTRFAAFLKIYKTNYVTEMCKHFMCFKSKNLLQQNDCLTKF